MDFSQGWRGQHVLADIWGSSLGCEWRRQRDRVGIWEATVVTQIRDDAGSAQVGGCSKGERQVDLEGKLGLGRAIK